MSFNQERANTMNSLAISNAIRRLEVDNTSWVTALMYTILFGPPAGIEDIRQRLLRNAEDFGRLFGQIYGPEVGDHMKSIMERYLDGSIALIEAYRDEDLTAIQESRGVLYDIADELALLFSSVNPYWDRYSVQAVLYKIIYGNEEEILRIKNRDYARSIQAHDELQTLLYEFSDELAAGIIRQFGTG
ncbi:MAG: hypothetical protein AAGU77_08290 [Bacillota bacterium]